MGKGDKKTKKGKIAIGSYGNTRKRRSQKPKNAVVAKKAETAAETPAKARKTARKKTEA